MNLYLYNVNINFHLMKRFKGKNVLNINAICNCNEWFIHKLIAI